MRKIYILIILITLGSCSKFPEKRVISINTESSLEYLGHKFNYGNLIDSTRDSWCEGVKGSGIGENITFLFEAPVDFDSFYIKNGNGEPGQFKYYNRVKAFRLSLNYKDTMLIPINDSGSVQKVKMGRVFKGMIFNLKIHSIFKGIKYDSTCISEIAFNPVEIYKKKIFPELEKSIFYQKSGYKFTMLSNGKIKGIGNGKLSCKFPFQKGWWNITNQGYLFINAVIEPHLNCDKLDAKILAHPYLGLITPFRI